MKTYLTSDTHFGHAGMMSARMNRPRSFTSVEAMNETVIQNWNNRVRKDDEIWHLGDFAYGASVAMCREVFARLNGRKHLILGNHDAGRTTSLPWYSQQQMAEPVIEGVRVVLCHYALRTWSGIHRGAIHCYGHSHGSLPGTSRSCDVGCDDWDFRPVTVSEILERLAENAAMETGPAAVAALAEAA
ncbi:metallophosphoesterase [Methylobacterium sp. BTF04]|uniref:metallophosphoesterase family protein n=1 Tax=Methylobacterium sp. BTF04 TaxID=2708300 RepID=UPI0013D863A9|nr:metallophosphoesterase family protein [Methylobacterium sp. BTF04]NEU12595.1 metallophosphoesterase [Methylobacterium sp. BTF04]